MERVIKILGIIIVFLVNFYSLSFTEEEINLLFKQANKYYDNAKYDSALVYYSKVDSILSASGKYSYKLYYNMANTYYKENDYVSSIYFLEKAFLINPYDNDIITNIAFVKSKIGDQRDLNDYFYFYIKIFNIKVYNSIIILLFIFILVTLILRFFKSKKKSIYKIVYTITIIYLFSFLIYTIIYLYFYKNFKYAIVKEDTSLYSEPFNGKYVSNIYKGYKVRILKRNGKFLFINYNKKISGWIESDRLLLINF